MYALIRLLQLAFCLIPMGFGTKVNLLKRTPAGHQPPLTAVAAIIELQARIDKEISEISQGAKPKERADRLKGFRNYLRGLKPMTFASDPDPNKVYAFNQLRRGTLSVLDLLDDKQLSNLPDEAVCREFFNRFDATFNSKDQMEAGADAAGLTPISTNPPEKRENKNVFTNAKSLVEATGCRDET